jgi:ribulose-phosphate 3-epimerase
VHRQPGQCDEGPEATISVDFVDRVGICKEIIMSGVHPPRVLLAPSILSADFARLGEQVAEAAAAGADWLHVDVMDGHFVPNISIGIPVVAALRRVTTLPLDVHLMIAEPERYIDAFAEAGADHLTVHIEACPAVERVVRRIRAAGVKPGVTLRPATPLEGILGLLPAVHQVLVMSVDPGFGGQSFIPASLERIAALDAHRRAYGLAALIAVDGGINAETAAGAVAAGADVLVAGSAVFTPSRPVADGLAALREAARAGLADRAPAAPREP